MKLESLALHHGYKSEATTRAAAVPIYQTTSIHLTIPSMGPICLISKLWGISTPGS